MVRGANLACLDINAGDRLSIPLSVLVADLDGGLQGPVKDNETRLCLDCFLCRFDELALFMRGATYKFSVVE
jgi:hypothetical protein